MEIREAGPSSGAVALPRPVLPRKHQKELDFLERKDLLTSRVVRRDLRNYVDEVYEPTKWKWKPDVPKTRGKGAVSPIMEEHIGTRFSKAAEVKQFLITADAAPNDENLFINRTLIRQRGSLAQSTGLFQVFPYLAAGLGDMIQHCVYFVEIEVPESVKNITTIFELANLQSLVIHCEQWGRSWILKNYFNGGIKIPKNIKSITVLGVDNYIFRQALNSSKSPHLKRLVGRGRNYSIASPGVLEEGFKAFPNIEELKICDVYSQELIFCGIWPLKRLSVKIDPGELYVLLGDILDSLQRFAGTLESFRLQFLESQMTNNKQQQLKNKTLTFPNVTALRMPYYAGMAYANEFAGIFMNMKHLQLVDDGERFLNHNDMNPNIAIGQVLRPLWEQLPEGLEMVSVRYRKYIDGKGLKGGSMTQEIFLMRSDDV